MAGLVGPRVPVVIEPFTQQQDFDFTDYRNDAEIAYMIDVGSRTVSIVARSIFIPDQVTIRGNEIQLFTYPHNGNVTCLGQLLCQRLLVNTNNLALQPSPGMQIINVLNTFI